MEELDGDLTFDFEGGLTSVLTSAGPGLIPGPSAPPIAPIPGMPVMPSLLQGSAEMGSQSRRRGFRQTVCRHWLRGLCMKGPDCGFLHQFDKSRMPLCRFFARFGECKEADCLYKHSLEDIRECNMYKLGFCPNGSNCRYRHKKLPGPPPPVEETLANLHQRGRF